MFSTRKPFTKTCTILSHFVVVAIVLSVTEGNLQNFTHQLSTDKIKFELLEQLLLNEVAASQEDVQTKFSTEIENEIEIDIEPNDEYTNFGILTSQHNTHLIQSSFIYGLSQVTNRSLVNVNCYRHLKRIQHGILRKESWAIKVLDGSGSKSSGFMFGNNYWFGSREICQTLRYPLKITLSGNHERIMHYNLMKEMPPFTLDYRVIYLKHNSPWQIELKVMSEQIIHVGLCLPASCTNNEIQYLMDIYVQQQLQQQQQENFFFLDNDIYDMRPKVLYMKDLRISQTFYQRNSFRLLSALFTFTITMIIMAIFLRKIDPTIYNIYNGHITIKEHHDINDVIKKGHLLGASYSHILNISPAFQDFIISFDIIENWSKLFTIKSNTIKDIPIMNGLRSLCSIWILFFHVAWYMYFTVNNKPILVSYAEMTYFQYLSSAPIIVDVFFTISGFLHVYNFLRNREKLELIRQNNLWQNVQQFMRILWHRYIRLLPLYLVVIMMVDLLYAYLDETSIYHIHEKFDYTCSKYWWRNLLFIQNFYPYDDMCLNWSWSLACEMQFFIMATILLFIYVKNAKLAKCLTLAALMGNILWSYAICLHVNFQLSFDTLLSTVSYIYFSTFVRILPYIIGAIMAWYLMEIRQQQIQLSDQQENLLWSLSILIFFVCIFSTMKRDLSAIYATTLIVFGRICFALAVSWMILGSATGHKCWWSHLLETKFFQHFNKLSYAIYLLNPFIIGLCFGLTNGSTHFDPIIWCILCAGFVLIIYLLSIVISLLFEIPFYNILGKRNRYAHFTKSME